MAGRCRVALLATIILLMMAVCCCFGSPVANASDLNGNDFNSVIANRLRSSFGSITKIVVRQRNSHKSAQQQPTSSSHEKRESFDWSYWHDNGPHVWPQYYQAGLGHEQSPINIVMNSPTVGFDRLLTPIRFNYRSAHSFTLKNNAKGFYIDFEDKSDAWINGGPLLSKYYLAKIDVHWGVRDDDGSEHTINCQAYTAELQLVHFNKPKYKTYEKASKYSDGFAIVSIFLKLGYDQNPVMTVLSKYLHLIGHPFAQLQIFEELPLLSLLPINYDRYWTYPGSLTQPPLTENVIWIILRNPIVVTPNELNAFRSLHPFNIRPIQPLNHRVIRASYMEF